ncbi:MAG: membrane protein insertion efficiency factor YidD [Propionibacteriaceae bacterium]|jgi:putative membrane protein insertion efficiency factor|nr:membrane protein insertion efficiency factor YidD [Propionibacteriaceae bacterium]
MKYLLVGFVRLWRMMISPLYANRSSCQFHPSCSAYGLEALQVHGAFKGSWLTIRRLGRCHPWSRGGYDPVPGTPQAAAWAIELAELKASAATQTARDETNQEPAQAHQQCYRPDFLVDRSVTGKVSLA